MFHPEDIMVTVNGSLVRYDETIELMDDDLREELHAELAGECTCQGFVNMYVKRHCEKFKEKFTID